MSASPRDPANDNDFTEEFADIQDDIDAAYSDLVLALTAPCETVDSEEAGDGLLTLSGKRLVVLLDIGGVLMPDSWPVLLLTPGEGIADRLGLDVTRVEEAANLLWPEFSLQERTEQDWWQALGRMVGMTIPPKLVIEVETKLLKPLAGAAELIRRAHGLGDVGVISDNTSFWYQKQASRLGLERRILPSLRFLSFERQVAKSSLPIGLFEVAAEGLSGQKVVVLDDRNANCERARAVGFTAILIGPQRATSHV